MKILSLVPAWRSGPRRSTSRLCAVWRSVMTGHLINYRGGGPPIFAWGPRAGRRQRAAQDLPLRDQVFLLKHARRGLAAIQKKIRLPKQKRLPQTLSHAEV
jgi:hypothetical protein